MLVNCLAFCFCSPEESALCPSFFPLFALALFALIAQSLCKLQEARETGKRERWEISPLKGAIPLRLTKKNEEGFREIIFNLPFLSIKHNFTGGRGGGKKKNDNPQANKQTKNKSSVWPGASRRPRKLLYLHLLAATIITCTPGSLPLPRGKKREG